MHRRHVHFVERGEDGGGRLRLHAAARRRAGAGATSARAARAVAPRLAGGRGAGARAPRARAAGAGGARSGAVLRSALRCTSPLVMRPPRPRAGDVAAPTSCSAIILRAAGSAPVGGAMPAAAAAAPSRGAAAQVRRPASSARSDAPLAAPAPHSPRLAPSVSITAMTSCAATVEPSRLADLGEHAGVGRRQLEHDLVGLDVDQVLVALDRVARPSCAN